MMPGPQLQYFETARMLVLRGSGKRHQPRLAGAHHPQTQTTPPAAAPRPRAWAGRRLRIYEHEGHIDGHIVSILQALPHRD